MFYSYCNVTLLLFSSYNNWLTSCFLMALVVLAYSFNCYWKITISIITSIMDLIFYFAFVALTMSNNIVCIDRKELFVCLTCLYFMFVGSFSFWLMKSALVSILMFISSTTWASFLLAECSVNRTTASSHSSTFPCSCWETFPIQFGKFFLVGFRIYLLNLNYLKYFFIQFPGSSFWTR